MLSLVGISLLARDMRARRTSVRLLLMNFVSAFSSSLSDSFCLRSLPARFTMTTWLESGLVTGPDSMISVQIIWPREDTAFASVALTRRL